MQLKFENWKTGRQIVVRDDKGRLITRTKQKGSNIKTKAQATTRFKQNGSLSKNLKVLSKRLTRVEKTNKVKIKTQDKTITINQSIERGQLIGKNTALIKSKNVLKGHSYYQYIAKVEWGKERIKTIGYSNIKGTRLQAFERARQGAIQLNLINYDDNIEFTNQTEGFSTNGRTMTYFKVSYEVGTYVRAESTQTIKTK